MDVKLCAIGMPGVPELLIILAVALLIFGPKNLPKLGSSLGKTVKGLREGMSSDKVVEDADEVVEEVAEEPVKKATKKAAAPKKDASEE